MTDATRKQAERQRKRAAGLAPLEIWAPPALHDDIRKMVALAVHESAVQCMTPKSPAVSLTLHGAVPSGE
jgi:hypothetical protein